MKRKIAAVAAAFALVAGGIMWASPATADDAPPPGEAVVQTEEGVVDEAVADPPAVAPVAEEPVAEPPAEPVAEEPAPVVVAPVAPVAPAPVVPAAPVAPVAPVAPAQPAAPAVSGPFKNCTEAWAAGAAPVHVGDPGYAPRLDRDNDGIGCEQRP